MALSLSPSLVLQRRSVPLRVDSRRACATRRRSLHCSATLDAAQLSLTVTDALFGTPLKAAGTLGISFASFRAILYFNVRTNVVSSASTNPRVSTCCAEPLTLLACSCNTSWPRTSGTTCPPAPVSWSVRAELRSALSPAPPHLRSPCSDGVGTGVHLNYYNNAAFVYGVDTKADPGLLLTVGAQAGVAVSAQKVASYAERLNVDSGSADAAVSVNALGGERDAAAAVEECARVLKPGGQLVFFEEGRAPGPLTDALGKSGLFSSVRYDDKWANYPLAPHAIGLALRNDTPPRGEKAAAGNKAAGKPRREREPSPASKGKGFGGKA